MHMSRAGDQQANVCQAHKLLFCVYKHIRLAYRITGKRTTEEIITDIKLDRLKFIWNYNKHAFPVPVLLLQGWIQASPLLSRTPWLCQTCRNWAWVPNPSQLTQPSLSLGINQAERDCQNASLERVVNGLGFQGLLQQVPSCKVNMSYGSCFGNNELREGSSTWTYHHSIWYGRALPALTSVKLL